MSELYSDFTESEYRKLLLKAKSRWQFSLYAEWKADQTQLLWRHDVDMSVHRALSLARIECEVGVSSTYFLMLHSAFYNLLERDIVKNIESIIGMGHAIGLHFDPTFYGDKIVSKNQLAHHMIEEKSLIEMMFDVEVKAFSWHNPTCGDWLSMDDDICAGMVNVYGRGIRTQYSYVSDSNGEWRHGRLCDVLKDSSAKKLHVLTHPEWWQEEAISPRERVFRSLDGRTSAVMQQNDELLAEFGRGNLGKLAKEFLYLKEKFGSQAEQFDYRWMRGEFESVFVDLLSMFEAQLVQYCCAWFSKELCAKSSEIETLIESPQLNLSIFKIYPAITGQDWIEILDVTEEEFLTWLQVRNHLLHGYSSYSKERLEEGALLLISLMRRLRVPEKTSLIDSGVNENKEKMFVADLHESTCFEWLGKNMLILGLSDEQLSWLKNELKIQRI